MQHVMINAKTEINERDSQPGLGQYAITSTLHAILRSVNEAWRAPGLQHVWNAKPSVFGAFLRA
jgi:hypothetical protein